MFIMPITFKMGKSDSNGKSTSGKFSLKRPSLKSLFVLLIVIGSLSAAGYFYYLYRTSTTTEIAETKRTIDAVARLMSVPANEVPTVATVTDKTKLKQQPFFKAAENGDKVLIYSSIKKAILYRP